MNRDTNGVAPLVSVVVPVFNGMPHLTDLVASILGQTHTDLDIVFSEGGGSDRSLDYLRSLDDSRIRIIEQPPGTPAAENWTRATQAGTGEYIKLVCQDDLLAPDAIARQVLDLRQHPSAVMAIGQRDIVDARGRTLYARRGCTGLADGCQPGAQVIATAFRGGTNVLGEPLAVLFTREALLAAMPWDDSNPLVLDLSTYAKVAAHGDVVVRRESLGAFRVSTSSWSTRLAKVQLAQYHQWQDDYARATAPPPTARELAQARRAARVQTALRRGAYTWLRLKGSFKSQG